MSFSGILASVVGVLSNPLVLKVGLSLIENILVSKNLKDDEKALFIKVAQLIRERMGVDIRSRFESEAQIDAGNAEWDRREKVKADGKTKVES